MKILSISKLPPSVFEPQSVEDFKQLQELIELAETEYPGISAWWRKIKPGFRDGTRRGLLIRNVEGLVVGGTVIKLGASAKLCSMRIIEEGRGQGFGQKLWDSTIGLIKGLGYGSLHFTMPYDVWDTGWFAAQKGVEEIGWLKAKQFRSNGIDEIVCDP